MICKKCGTVLEESNPICPNCGTLMEEDSLFQDQQAEITQAPPIKKFYGKAIAGFVLSLVGILVAAIPCGIIGLIFSAMSMKQVELPQYKGKGLAVSGLIISIVDICLGLVYLFM